MTRASGGAGLGVPANGMTSHAGAEEFRARPGDRRADRARPRLLPIRSGYRAGADSCLGHGGTGCFGHGRADCLGHEPTDCLGHELAGCLVPEPVGCLSPGKLPYGAGSGSGLCFGLARTACLCLGLARTSSCGAWAAPSSSTSGGLVSRTTRHERPGSSAVGSRRPAGGLEHGISWTTGHGNPGRLAAGSKCPADGHEHQTTEMAGLGRPAAGSRHPARAGIHGVSGHTRSGEAVVGAMLRTSAEGRHRARASGSAGRTREAIRPLGGTRAIEPTRRRSAMRAIGMTRRGSGTRVAGAGRGTRTMDRLVAGVAGGRERG